MNLKRIKDNLYINSEKWIYTPITGKKPQNLKLLSFFCFLISEVFQK